MTLNNDQKKKLRAMHDALTTTSRAAIKAACNGKKEQAHALRAVALVQAKEYKIYFNELEKILSQ